MQLIVAAAWPIPYDWANHFISDLGNTVCGDYAGLYVCSPLFWLMNLSFIIFGLTMIAGAQLIYTEFARSRASFFGFLLMAIAGFGTILVGAFPENTVNQLHMIGAFLGLGVGNLSIIILAFALKQLRTEFRVYSVISGVVSLIAFGLFLAGIDLELGRGGMERLISYPFTVWMVSLGVYMTVVRMRHSIGRTKES